MVEVDLSAASDMNYKPSLYDVHVVLEEHIVGEHESRMAVFTNWLLAHQNVNMTGQRSSGKTWITDHVAMLLPVDSGLYDINKGSEKSSWYQAEMLRKHSHVRITEFNKLTKDMKETLKDWGEGKDSDYKVTVMEGGNRYVKEYKLVRKPFIFCLADEDEDKVDEQLRSRLTVIRTDQSEEQNKAVIEKQADLAFLKDNPSEVSKEMMKDMRLHISTLPTMSKTRFKHPSSKIFQDCIPKIFTDSRRDFPKYLNNTFGITRFFWKDRMSYIENGYRVFFVTPQDMWYNHVIFGNMLIESALKCSNMERQLIEILQDSTYALSRNEMMKKVRARGMNISGHMMSRHMGILADLGYIEKEVDKKFITYKTSDMFKDFHFEVDWKEVFDECIKNMKNEYPDHADEYIKRYCDGDQTVIHPFNNIEINLKDLAPPEKVKADTLKFDETSSNNTEEMMTEEEWVDD